MYEKSHGTPDSWRFRTCEQGSSDFEHVNRFEGLPDSRKFRVDELPIVGFSAQTELSYELSQLAVLCAQIIRTVSAVVDSISAR